MLKYNISFTLTFQQPQNNIDPNPNTNPNPNGLNHNPTIILP